MNISLTAEKSGKFISYSKSYNGKELDSNFEMNLYDYGSRYYDAAIGRFIGVDPISKTFPYDSTYNYAENEPIVNIDLWGLQKFRSGYYFQFNISAKITQGIEGAEGRLIGIKGGGLRKINARSLASLEFSVPHSGGSPLTLEGFNDKNRTTGFSGGIAVGGEYSKLFEDEKAYNSVKVNYGIAYSEWLEAEDGSDISITGIELGGTFGLDILGIDFNISIELIDNVQNSQCEDCDEQKTQVQRDNTRVNQTGYIDYSQFMKRINAMRPHEPVMRDGDKVIPDGPLPLPDY